MIIAFLWKDKERCWFISYVIGRSANNDPNNIFHDYSKAVFPTENVFFSRKMLFPQKEDAAKKLFSYCWKH